MRKTLLSLSLAVSAAAGAASPQAVTLYGQHYNGNGDHGIYSFSSDATAGMEKVADLVAEPNCGSVKTADRFYCFSSEAGDYGAEFSVYVYDTTDNYRLITRIGSVYSIAKPSQVLAYDPSSSKIYSVFQESGYYGTDTYLGIVDLSNRTMTKVGSSLYFGYGATTIVAMAFNSDGELYGIASNSYLYKIDKSTGNLTNIGSTGITPRYEQSMAFSPDGSTIFWAACNDDICGLYAVDPTTAATTKIKDFTDNEEFVSLWVGDIVAADGAPAAPGNLTADFPGGALSGTISFTAPVLTHAGDPLEGEIDYRIMVENTEVGSGSTFPGEETACAVTVDASGLYDFKIILSNAEGIGESATLDGVYIGVDTPMGVENLHLERGANPDEFVVTWDAPAEGAHGGYIDLSSLKYRVRRLPDFETLSEDATSPFVDSFVSEAPVKCAYEVTPYVDENTRGLSLTTNRIMVGKPFETPYSEDFSSNSTAQSWTVDDVNGDGHSWEYMWDFGYYRIYDNENPKDDWLISPYVRLETGGEYRLTFDVRTIATEKLEVKMGAGLSPEELTVPLMEAETIPDTDYDWVPRECNFTCAQGGNLHIGFHALADDPENALALYIDNVKLVQTGSSAVTEISGDAAGAAAFAVDGRGVRALDDVVLEVCRPDGRLVFAGHIAAGEWLPLDGGMYIIRAQGSAAVKALIK